MNNQLMVLLNKEVANFTVMYTKLHNFHWYVKGIHFFQLHQKFEELYNEITEFLDQVAERLLMIDGKPLGTLKECLEKASVKEACNVSTEGEMVNEIISDYDMMKNELIEGITQANENQDDVTADLLTQIKTNFDKHLWMLKSMMK